jgi:hypothetical protein
MRQKDLRDRLGLTPEPTTAGLAPERHLATVEIPEAAQFEGRHAWRVRAVATQVLGRRTGIDPRNDDASLIGNTLESQRFEQL